jgi:hypothetical protein
MTSSKPQTRASIEPFRAARATLDEIVSNLSGDTAPRAHGDLEASIRQGTQELSRQLLQARLDVLFERERSDLGVSAREAGVQVRVRQRQLESEFGRVVIRRHGLTLPGETAARFAMDEELNLPGNLYSHSLRERVVDEARRGAWDQAVEQVDGRTGGHVPKRQAENLAVHVTQDFEAFYEQRPAAENDHLSPAALLVSSSDSKGIRMRPEALREGTRKAAAEERRSAVRGDPMAKKKLRLHDKRMAIVTAVWEQEPHRRVAKDVIDNLRRDPKAKRRKKSRQHQAPRPQDKRLVASVEKSQAEGVAEMFDELDRRDPSRGRTAVVLLDGEENQQSAILTQGIKRERKLTLVLDIIHALHYLWCAGFVLCGKNATKTDEWTVRFLQKLLTRPVQAVIADIQRSLAQHALSPSQRKPVDACIKYFTRNSAWMRYPDFLAAGLPIATGVIEGACRHLIQDRLGISGARWGVDGAEAILKLRALHSNDHWDDYWRFHRQREAIRNYPMAA